MDYLNIPFVERGRTLYGLDCYGLCRMIFQDQRGIELPSYAEEYATTTDAEEIMALCRGEVATRWREVPVAEATLFDGVIFRIMGQPIHFGLVLDSPYFIHTMKNHWSGVERWDGLLWQQRLTRVVRYDP